MVTKKQVLSLGFVPYIGGPISGNDFKEIYTKPVDGLGWNLGIDFAVKAFFYFEGDRSTALPYPIPAKIIQYYQFPKSEETIRDIFRSITGREI
jgi:hypothetical protein